MSKGESMEIFKTGTQGDTLYKCRTCSLEFPEHYIEGFVPLCKKCGNPSALVSHKARPKESEDIVTLIECKKCRRKYSPGEILNDDYGRYAGICKQCFLTEMANRNDLVKKHKE